MFYNLLKKLTNYLSTEIPPGPKILKLKHVINLQKGGTFFYVLSLMNYFKNYNKTAYLYLSLHGTYGLIWLIKDRVIPDKGWERKSTILSSIASFLLVLGPYWVSPYLIIKNKVNISNFRSALCIFTHTLGCVVMMASDTQKYFQLEMTLGQYILFQELTKKRLFFLLKIPIPIFVGQLGGLPRL